MRYVLESCIGVVDVYFRVGVWVCDWVVCYWCSSHWSWDVVVGGLVLGAERYCLSCGGSFLSEQVICLNDGGVLVLLEVEEFDFVGCILEG